MDTKKSNTPGPDSKHQRRENFQPPTRQFNSRLLLQRSGWIQRLVSNLNDLFTVRDVKVARATTTGRDSWGKDENFSRSQAVSFAVHGGLAMLLLISLPTKIPIVENIKQLTPRIFAPDPKELRFLVVRPTLGASHGGGSGGERNPIPASAGQPPPFANRDQIVAPSIIRNPDAVLALPPTLVGPDQHQIIDPNILWGDPNAILKTDSNGPGCCAGMGPHDGSGIGDGIRGSGLGPGLESGVGGGPPNSGSRSGIRYPTCAYCPRPDYSDEARHNRYQGSVLLYVVILPNGRAGNIEVVKSPGLGLDVKAIEAIRNWKFNPAIGPDGKPMAVVVPVEVAFQLF